MVPCQFLCVSRIASAQERSSSGEPADHLASLHRRSKVSVEMPQQIFHFLARQKEFVTGRDFLLGSPNEQAPLPWNREQHAAIVGFWNQQRVVARKHFSRQDDVNALAQPDSRFGSWIRHRAN